MSFTLQTLTEGIRDRHVGQQNKRLVEKWSRTGLLRGMDDTNRENMATLLENQAAQLLRESNTLTGGDVRGFTNIAFPIVRRVFGGLVANELVSIQPMSLPSGLLFYLDYTYGNSNGPHAAGESIYGQPAGKAVQNGSLGNGGQYDLVGTGFSRRFITTTDPNFAAAAVFSSAASHSGATLGDALGAVKLVSGTDPQKEADRKLLQFDSQILDLIEVGGEHWHAIAVPVPSGSDKSLVKEMALLVASGVTLSGVTGPDGLTAIQGGRSINVRRLNQLGSLSGTTWTADALNGSHVLMIVKGTNSLPTADCVLVTPALDTFSTDTEGSALTVPAFEGDGEGGTADATDGSASLDIPEIDIKIESIPVTAQTRKLRARWSPELAQDLNAYHSMDAEVELTQILSEQIALEIDREILNDLLTGAQGANFFWSRAPGRFVNKRTGADQTAAGTLTSPAFTGTVREWYETLTETIIDVANEIHRKTLRGSANFIVVGPDVATILEASVLYRPSYSLDGDGQVGAPFTMGAEKTGTLSNRFTVYKDPYFPRNKVLVGYKGGSYLETGFVYAPYVPLIVTPTIFQPDDFTPRKGVMTRYGKKMVRADFFGTVTCLDMNII